MKKLFISILLIISTLSISAQDSIVDEAKVMRNVGIALGCEAGLYAATMTGLYFAWYSGSKPSRFHFINDNAGWLQMDKGGHCLAAYSISKIGYEVMRATGLDERRSIWYGGTLGIIFQTTVEIFDGFSPYWGFSWGDMLANTVGSGLFLGQQLLWHDQRITLKYSFHPTEFPQYNPKALGSNFAKQLIKDYNGITYWASFNIKSLFLDKESKFPAWLNFAFGYGADGMIDCFENPTEIDGVPVPYFDRKRQFYFSLDVDFTKIPTNSQFLKYTFKVLNFFKLPFPAIEYNTQGQWVWHWLYF